MAAHPDPAVRAAALSTLRELVSLGYAGLDEYDTSRFIVDAPEPFLSDGERACDDLGGFLLRTCPAGMWPLFVAALLPQRVRDELGLDEPGARRLPVALASRRAETAA